MAADGTALDAVPADRPRADLHHVFLPAVARADAAAQQTRDLLGRVYHGSLSLLVSAMAQQQALTQAEIDELYALLHDMEEKQRHD